jgi:hypothetical protein
MTRHSMDLSRYPCIFWTNLTSTDNVLTHFFAPGLHMNSESLAESTARLSL